MNHEKAIRQQRIRRRFRVRKKLRGTTERPRLSVHRSLKHIYCQLIDDANGKTIASASSRDKELRSDLQRGNNKDAAAAVGAAIADRAKAAGVNSVCLDRGNLKYHGRVASLTDAVREAGVSV